MPEVRREQRECEIKSSSVRERVMQKGREEDEEQKPPLKVMREGRGGLRARAHEEKWSSACQGERSPEMCPAARAP